jgi:hypothetical protein
MGFAGNRPLAYDHGPFCGPSAIANASRIWFCGDIIRFEYSQDEQHGTTIQSGYLLKKESNTHKTI